MSIKVFFQNSVRRNILFSTILFIIFLRILSIPYISSKYTYHEGDISREDIASIKYVLYIDHEKTQFKINERKKTIHPIFVYQKDAIKKSRNRLYGFLDFYYDEFKSKKSIKQISNKINKRYNVWISANSLRILSKGYSKNYIKTHINFLTSLFKDIVYLNVSKQKFKNLTEDYFILFKDQEERRIKPAAVKKLVYFSVDNIKIRKLLLRRYRNRNTQFKEMLMELVSKLAVPNVVYDIERSQLREEVLIEKIEPVMHSLKKGQIVVRKGDRITKQQLMMLKAINKNMEHTSYSDILGLGFLILVFSVLIIYHSQRYYGGFIKNAGSAYLIVLLLFFNTIFAAFVFGFLFKHFPDLKEIPLGIFVPISISSMCIALIINERTAFFFTIFFSFVVLIITKTDYLSFGLLVGSGFVSVYAASRSKKSIDLWKGGFYAFLFSFFCLIIHSALYKTSFSQVIYGTIGGFVNGNLSAVITIGLIPFFESITGIPTRFKLLELADTNSPLLREMLIEAPGTYSHSILVGNLAETAAENIGANALLTRVGSYYHDIGKIEKSEYFAENQQGNGNKHDDIKPSISKSILISHIKRGLEIGKKSGLPDVVLDFIPEHHGTSLIKYFYKQALDIHGTQVNKEDFRYPGPKPQSKETAIVMLADSVEAVSRVLKNPTPQRIETVVTEMIRNRFLDGDLNESPLTLRDLTIIAASFVKILIAIHHVRVEYPDDEHIKNSEKALKQTKKEKKK